MSAIQDCLSRFAVELYAPGPETSGRVDVAIEAYLETCGSDGGSRRRGLQTLSGCFGNMSPDNPAARLIRRRLRQRLTAMTPAGVERPAFDRSEAIDLRRLGHG